MHIGETARDGTTAIYGVDNISRGIAYSRDVARMWAASPDLVAALQYIQQLCGTENEAEFHHTLIPETCRAALELIEKGDVMSSRIEDDSPRDATCPECGAVAEWRDIEGHADGGEYFCLMGCVVETASAITPANP